VGRHAGHRQHALHDPLRVGRAPRPEEPGPDGLPREVLPRRRGPLRPRPPLRRAEGQHPRAARRRLLHRPEHPLHRRLPPATRATTSTW
jgi:hypothetical protein